MFVFNYFMIIVALEGRRTKHKLLYDLTYLEDINVLKLAFFLKKYPFMIFNACLRLWTILKPDLVKKNFCEFRETTTKILIL